MQKVPSRVSQTKSDEIKTTSKVPSDFTKTSSSTKQETKKPAENTDHTTVSTSFCGCKKDKCDAFFDKLLNYLEKQSDIIAKCCAHSRELRRESIEKTASTHELNLKPKPPSQTNHEMRKSQKGNPKANDKDCEKDSDDTDGKQKTKPDSNKEDFYSKPSRNKSNLDVGCNEVKIGDKPCNIYVEVCSCQKLGKHSPSRGSSKMIESESDQISVKQRLGTPQHRPSPKHSGYVLECQGYEQKVSYFLKLADEICEGYMKQCQERGDPFRSHVLDKRKPSREEVQHAVSKPYQSHPLSEEYYCDTPERDQRARPIAIEIECEGAKEQFVVDPCRCPSGGPRHREGPKRNCLDVFEERYGKTLRDLQTKLLDASPSKPNQAPYGDQALLPQQSPPPVCTCQQPAQQPTPPVFTSHQPPLQQQPSTQKLQQPSSQKLSQTPPKKDPELPKPKRNSTPSDDDSSERRKPKKKDNKKDKKMKKKSSQ